MSDQKRESTNAKPEIPKTEGRNVKSWIVSGILFLALSFIGGFYGKELAQWIQEKITPATAPLQWEKIACGKYGIAVESPVGLKEGRLEVPANLRDVVQDMSTYSYEGDNEFKILVNSVLYSPKIGEVDLAGAAHGSIAEMRAQKGSENFDYKEDTSWNHSIRGYIQRGSYRLNGIDVEFINAGYGKGLNLWQVFTMYRKEDKAGKSAAEKIMSSIDIRYQ